MNILKELLTSYDPSQVHFGSLLFIEEIEKITKDNPLYKISYYNDIIVTNYVIYILYKGEFNITIRGIAIDIDYDLEKLPEYLNNLPVER